MSFWSENTRALVNRFSSAEYSRVHAPLDMQRRRIREMSADEKVRIAHALWMEARSATAAGVRARHPEWSEAQVAQRVRELMLDAGS